MRLTLLPERRSHQSPEGVLSIPTAFRVDGQRHPRPEPLPINFLELPLTPLPEVLELSAEVGWLMWQGVVARHAEQRAGRIA